MLKLDLVENNLNIVLLANTGFGKSFEVNSLIGTYLACGRSVLVIDSISIFFPDLYSNFCNCQNFYLLQTVEGDWDLMKNFDVVVFEEISENWSKCSHKLKLFVLISSFLPKTKLICTSQYWSEQIPSILQSKIDFFAFGNIDYPTSIRLSKILNLEKEVLDPCSQLQKGEWFMFDNRKSFLVWFLNYLRKLFFKNDKK